MAHLIPHLWFNRNAAEAAVFYTRLIPNSSFNAPETIHDTPSGDVEVSMVTLGGLGFQFLSAGTEFRFTPAISFRIDCASAAEVERIAGALLEGGSALMPLGAYPFSGRYAWVADRFGLNWQVMLTDVHPRINLAAPTVTPTLMFVGTNAGHAEAAIRHYAGLFPGATVGEVDRYQAGEAPDAPGTVRQVGFQLAGVNFAAMDSAHEHGFTFSEAVSFLVITKDQAETDHYWDALTADPSAEACGWLKDRWGLSWQIVPEALGRLMSAGGEQTMRVTQAFLKMKRLVVADLEKAAQGTL